MSSTGVEVDSGTEGLERNGTAAPMCVPGEAEEENLDMVCV